MEVSWNRGTCSTPKSYPIRRFRLGFEDFIDSVSDVLRLLLQPLWQLRRDLGCDELLNRLSNLSDVRLGLYDGPKNAARRQLTLCLLVGYSCLREGNFEILQAARAILKFSKPSACKPGFAAEVCLSDTEPTQVLRGHVALCIFARVFRRRPALQLCNILGPRINKTKGTKHKIWMIKKSKPLTCGFWNPWIGDFGFTQQLIFFLNIA